jgi:hypothetical protein
VRGVTDSDWIRSAQAQISSDLSRSKKIVRIGARNVNPRTRLT